MALHRTNLAAIGLETEVELPEIRQFAAFSKNAMLEFGELSALA